MQIVIIFATSKKIFVSFIVISAEIMKELMNQYKETSLNTFLVFI